MRPLLKLTGIISLITLVLVVGIEVLLRITGASEPVTYFPEIFALNNPGDMQPAITEIRQDKTGNEYKLTTNDLGFRTTGALINNPKKKILCIGDSFTQGIISDEETFPFYLQNFLRKRSYQVYNAGIPGYTMEDELNYLKEKGLSVKPDIIVLTFCKNDFTDYADFWRKTFRRMGAGKWRNQKFRNFLKTHAHLFSLAKKMRIYFAKQEVKKETRKNIAFDVNREELEASKITDEEIKLYRQKYSEDFKIFYELCIRENIKIIPLIFPSSAQINGHEDLSDQEFLQEMFSTHGLVPVDLYEVLQNFDADSVFIKGDGHPRGRTNKIAAEKIVKAVESM